MSSDFRSAGSVPVSQVMRLPAGPAGRFVEQLRRTSAPLRSLLERFEGEDFRFDTDRAQAFVYVSQGPDEQDGGDPRGRLSSFVMAVLPSYRPATAADPGHQAVSVAVHQSGTAVAGLVDIEHDPFRLVRFTRIQPRDDGTFEEFGVDAAAVAEDDLATLASRLGTRPVGRVSPRQLPGAIDFPHLQTITAAMFEELINDPVARPVYPAAAVGTLLAQTPLVQKFATANVLQHAERVRQAVGADTASLAAIRLEGACTSTSSSSNACSSTSTSVSVTLSE